MIESKLSRLFLLSAAALSLLLLGACPEPTSPGPDVTDVSPDVPVDAPVDTADAGDSTDISELCNCAGRVCGIAPPGDPVGCTQQSCGECTGEAESCGPSGQCVIKGAPGGSWCGLTADCTGLVVDPADPTQTIVNPNLELCLNNQCQSKVCLSTPSGGKFVTSMPACSASCTVKKDDDSNGVEDDDVTSDCAGYVEDGPAGETDWQCVSFSDPEAVNPIAFCMPRATYDTCDANGDCPKGEGCTFTSIQGALVARCMRRPAAGDWGSVEENGATCDEEGGDVGAAKYCGAGWCLNVCASYCESDVDCDNSPPGACSGAKCTNYPDRDCGVDADCATMACEVDGVQLFAPNSGVPAQAVCLPVDCELDKDCAEGNYCDRSGAQIQPDQTLILTKSCEPLDPTGGALGASCDAENPCQNSDQCIDGFCSTYCDSVADCAAEQLCVVDDTIFLIEEGPPEVIQAASVERCESFQGGGPACSGQFECDAYAASNGLNSHRCAIYVETNDDPDAPILVGGKCIPSVGTQDFGTLCTDDVQCSSGTCLGGNFCSLTCNSSAGCPSPLDPDEKVLTGYCRSVPAAFGGDINDSTTDAYTGLCFFTGAEGGECGSDFVCPTGEACAPLVLTQDPTKAPTVEYLCLDNTNPDGNPGTKAPGESCDPDATNAQGISLTECASGLCFKNETGLSAYCSELCKVDGDCVVGYECLERVIYERKGAYSANTGAYMACQLPPN